MSSLGSYLRQEGFLATVKRAFLKFAKGQRSSTIFLKAGSGVDLSFRGNDVEFVALSEENRSEFEKIKFWEFVKADDYIDNPYQSVLMLRKNREIVGYVAEQHEIRRLIHGTGVFVLSIGEGWIGPVYVSSDNRGNGYNRMLLKEQIRTLRAKGIDTFYTAINSENLPSLRSFMSVGFRQIGEVSANGESLSDSYSVLAEKFHQEEV